MSFHGALEDLPLVDVLQFIHLGRRTGTLYLWLGKEKAEIGFHDGKIVSAWRPAQAPIGDILVQQERLTAEELKKALASQGSETPRRPIGLVLVELQATTAAEIQQAFEQQIQETIFELLRWRRGQFDFVLDELRLAEDLGLTPEKMLSNLELNTQRLLLEASRIHDEQRRRDPHRTMAVEDRRQREGLRDAAARLATDEPSRRGPTATSRIFELQRVQVVTENQEFLLELRAALPADGARPVLVGLIDAGTQIPGERTPPIVIFDLSNRKQGPKELAGVSRRRPRSPIIAVTGSSRDAAAAFAAGALACPPADPETVAASCLNLARILDAFRRTVAPSSSFSERARFGRMMVDLQTGLLSTTIALNLMHAISESVERAVLFVVRGKSLCAEGAFGFSTRGMPLAEETRGLELAASSRFGEAIAEGRRSVVQFDDGDLPEQLADSLGRPENGSGVIFPVLGTDRTIALLYTDNGSKKDEVSDLEILELSTAQMGLAFENELLRQSRESRLASSDS